jgi:hypothetical protein
MSLPFTRESANSAILVLAVIHESLMFFSSALPNADPVMSVPPITNAVQNVKTVRVCIIFSLTAM